MLTFRWRFACQIVLNEFVRPRLASFKWETIKENVRRYKEYQQIYLDQLNHKHIKQHQQRAKVTSFLFSSTFLDLKMKGIGKTNRSFQFNLYSTSC